MERKKRYFLKERFLHSSKAFLLLEALLCLSLFSFALILFLKFLSTPKVPPSLSVKSPLNSSEFSISSKIVILKSGELEFEALQKTWRDTNQTFITLEDFK